MRTIIEVPEKDIDLLDEIGRRQNCSQAALIREAIAQYLVQKSVPPAKTAFGIWKDRAVDGIAYEDEVRAEWPEP